VKRPRVVIIGGKSPLRAAHDLGAECVYVEQPGKISPAKIALADNVLAMDYTDTELLCRVVRAWHDARPFDAVISMTEPGLLPAAVLAGSLGLGGPSAETVGLLRDKAAMRRRLATRGGQVPAETGTGQADIIGFARRHGYPCVVKPPLGTASEGVTLVRSEGDAAAVAQGMAARGFGAFLVESYLTGPEFSVETLSFDGEHVVVAITEKHVGPAFVELGHLVPARVSAADAAELRRATVDLLDAVGLRDGAAHTELRLGPDGARVIESHSRVGGDRINELVRIAWGVDMIAAAVTWHLVKERPFVPDEPRAAACVRFFTAPPGRVTRVAGVAELRGHPSVGELEVTVAEGDIVRPLEQSADRCGHLLVSAATPDKAANLGTELAAKVTIVTAGQAEALWLWTARTTRRTTQSPANMTDCGQGIRLGSSGKRSGERACPSLGRSRISRREPASSPVSCTNSA
jgi:biotin carboxylase